MRDERGFSLTELLVTMVAGGIVLSSILMLLQVTTTQTVKIADRTQANQLARPAIQRLMDQLHSTCVAPGVVPIQAGSDSNQMVFLSDTGSEVTPTPTRNVVTLSGTNLTQSVYPATGGTPPVWTFSGTPTSTRTLLTNVTPATVDGSNTTPLFRYYGYSGNQISTTTMPVPLDAVTAQQAVMVSVSMAVGSPENGSKDIRNPVTVSDQAVLRITPASNATSEVNPPCA